MFELLEKFGVLLMFGDFPDLFDWANVLPIVIDPDDFSSAAASFSNANT